MSSPGNLKIAPFILFLLTVIAVSLPASAQYEDPFYDDPYGKNPGNQMGGEPFGGPDYGPGPEQYGDPYGNPPENMMDGDPFGGQGYGSPPGDFAGYGPGTEEFGEPMQGGYGGGYGMGMGSYMPPKFPKGILPEEMFRAEVRKAIMFYVNPDNLVQYFENGDLKGATDFVYTSLNDFRDDRMCEELEKGVEICGEGKGFCDRIDQQFGSTGQGPGQEGPPEMKKVFEIISCDNLNESEIAQAMKEGMVEHMKQKMEEELEFKKMECEMMWEYRQQDCEMRAEREKQEKIERERMEEKQRQREFWNPPSPWQPSAKPEPHIPPSAPSEPVHEESPSTEPGTETSTETETITEQVTEETTAEPATETESSSTETETTEPATKESTTETETSTAPEPEPAPEPAPEETTTTETTTEAEAAPWGFPNFIGFSVLENFFQLFFEGEETTGAESETTTESSTSTETDTTETTTQSESSSTKTDKTEPATKESTTETSTETAAEETSPETSGEETETAASDETGDGGDDSSFGQEPGPPKSYPEPMPFPEQEPMPMPKPGPKPDLNEPPCDYAGHMSHCMEEAKRRNLQGMERESKIMEKRAQWEAKRMVGEFRKMCAEKSRGKEMCMQHFEEGCKFLEEKKKFCEESQNEEAIKKHIRAALENFFKWQGLLKDDVFAPKEMVNVARNLDYAAQYSGGNMGSMIAAAQTEVVEAAAGVEEINRQDSEEGLGYEISKFFCMQGERERKEAEKLSAQAQRVDGLIEVLQEVAEQMPDQASRSRITGMIQELENEKAGVESDAQAKAAGAAGLCGIFGG